MKFTTEESPKIPDTDESSICENEVDGKDLKGKYYCPNCTMLMTAFQDNSVQCELLTEEKGGPLLGIVNEINSGSRRGSVQSMTEVMEEVPYDKDVVTNDNLSAPDEILLVTRSFENEAKPKAPRRSSIAVILDGIKTLTNRRISAPAGPTEPSTSKAQPTEMLPRTRSSEEVQQSGRDVHRKSFQMDNGTVVEEETAEYDADKAVSTTDELAPGEVNFISRSFEIVRENPVASARRESLIDKINPFKVLEKIRKGSQTEAPNENSVLPEIEHEEPIAPCSGIRRKSLAPALLLGNITEDNEDKAELNGTDGSMPRQENEALEENADDGNCLDSVRYVTSGIRRGSVAAVSAAPPCRSEAEETPPSQKLSSHRHSNDENSGRARLVTEGIRRGSVAMVSAAPPCIRPSVDTCNDKEGNSMITELRIDENDALRSGIRRRSLTPANEGPQSRASSPVPSKRVAFGSTPDMTSLYDDSEPERERERKSSDAADEFFNRVQKRYTEPGKEKKVRKKGAVSLVEQLTGRDMGVDYSSIDAKSIQEKFDAEFDEKQRQREQERKSIPVITFSPDATEEHDVTDEDGVALGIKHDGNDVEIREAGEEKDDSEDLKATEETEGLEAVEKEQTNVREDVENNNEKEVNE